MNPELVEALSRRKLILFAGAGLSAGLGLPTWGRLIDRMANDLGYDAALFRGYGEFWTLAEYYVREKGGVAEICAWMEDAWHGVGVDVAASEAHRHIVGMAFPIIYTTNYDRWIELAHAAHGRDCMSIIDVDDMASASHDTVQVLKFHGDVRAPGSLVLTETDYFRRLSLDTPLDLRLRSDALGRSILFIGYSLTDPNVRMLLHRLRAFWEAAGMAHRQPRIFVHLSRPNPIQEAVLGNWGITVLHGDLDDPGEGLTGFLRDLRASLP